MKLKLTFDRSTKGTHVYKNDDPDAAVSTLYINRSALPKTPPATLNVEITTDETPPNGN